MEWIKLIIYILAGVAVSIPLIIELVRYVKLAIKERDWSKILSELLVLMARAETAFSNGTDRKTWVLSEIEAYADRIGYEIDMILISDMIDSLVAMSKKVNPPTECAEQAELEGEE